MLVVIDVGNTNITIGLYERNSDKLIQSYRLTAQNRMTSDEYGFFMTSFLNAAKIDVKDIDDVIISSVVPKIMHSFTNSIRKFFNIEPMIVGPGVKTGISIRIDNPRELGADRLVDAVGAYYGYGGDILVVDFGTATTFDFVSAKGEYLGGTTAPGIEISAQALSGKAAKLPEIQIQRVDNVLATNTIDSMQAGVYIGYVGLTEHIIQLFKAKMGDHIKVIATGGLGRIISEGTDEIDIYDPDLTFKGLRMIYERTKKG
ncbi:pantothenate kinase [Erysipelotrichaceae bacterium MTC7]|nr:pantothenate kinase [Erysipelotrichaceae bacterium MTC7]